MSSAAQSGLAPPVSQPLARGFLAFPGLEHSWMLWGNPSAGVKIRGKGLWELDSPANSNAPRHHCRCCRSVVPHCPFQLSQHHQAAVPQPQAQVLAPGWKPVVPGDSGCAFPAWGDPHRAVGLNSPGKGGRKIGKTITRICFMLPGSLPAHSSVFGRPIYNQQCGML